MRVLVVGTHAEAVDRVDRELQAAGHQVVRCHESDEEPFPCAALIDGRTCPLEGPPVDVAVTVRDRPLPRPSAYEDGAVCALRRHVPLVAVDAGINPFRPWTRLEVRGTDDVAAACEEAAAAPLPGHSEVATAVARTVIKQAGLEPEGTTAIVHRRRGALKVEIDLPDPAAHLRGMVAARVVTALRDLDKDSTGVDIGIAVAP